MWDLTIWMKMNVLKVDRWEWTKTVSMDQCEGLLFCWLHWGLAVDCIDCAADASVVSAVNEGIQAARDIVDVRRPWVMISVNDDQDLHFRKAGNFFYLIANYFEMALFWSVEFSLIVLLPEFDPENCPLDCSRPCEIVCPANAISLREEIMNEPSEVASLSGALKVAFPVLPYSLVVPNSITRPRLITLWFLKLKQNTTFTYEFSLSCYLSFQNLIKN